MILRNYPKLKFWLKKWIEITTNYRIRYHVPYWNKEKIVFTFDDGPLPCTMEVLDLLDKYKKKAVFFLVAENVRAYPQIAHEIIKRGHPIGLHCLNHVNMRELPLSEFSRQVKEGLSIIEKLCGIKIKYFRPPFGQINLIQTVWILMHKMILFFWSCHVSPFGEFDFINPKFEIRERFNLDKRSLIVLLHDHRPLDIIETSLTFFL